MLQKNWQLKDRRFPALKMLASKSSQNISHQAFTVTPFQRSLLGLKCDLMVKLSVSFKVNGDLLSFYSRFFATLGGNRELVVLLCWSGNIWNKQWTKREGLPLYEYYLPWKEKTFWKQNNFIVRLGCNVWQALIIVTIPQKAKVQFDLLQSSNKGVAVGRKFMSERFQIGSSSATRPNRSVSLCSTL